MKPKNSALSLRDIHIVASNLMAVPIPEGFTGTVNSIAIEIDFDIFQQKNDDLQFKIVVSVDGNDPENPIPGYCFNFIAEGLFCFERDITVKQEDKDMLLSRSAIPIVIGHIRAHLAIMTSSGPYGKFLLPVFDFNDLIQQKSKEIPSKKIV